MHASFKGHFSTIQNLLFKIEIVIVPSSTMGLSKETFILHGNLFTRHK